MDDDKEQDNESNTFKENTKTDIDPKQKIVEIINSVKPELIFEYCCGIYRYQLVDGELKRPNWKRRTIGTLIIMTYTILFFYFLFRDTDDDEGLNFMSTIDELPSVVVLFQYISSVVGTNFIFNSKSIRVITLLAEVDTMLEVEKFADFYKKISFGLNKVAIFLVVSHIVNTAMDLCSVEDIAWGITILPLYFLQRVEIFIFCGAVYMLNWRLKVINNYLKEFIKKQDKKNVTVFTVGDTKTKTDTTLNYIGRPSIRNAKIRDLATAYDNTGEICSLITDVYNFQVFLTLVSTFSYIVITIWTSINFYRKRDYRIRQLVNVMVWCFNMICNVAAMSFTCERLLVARTETRTLVNKVIMNYDLPKTMRVQAKAFMELIEAWPLRIYVYDMFSIDITLMLKFISVATTYLIVIIQISHFIS
uniref:Gustatory receptor n=1 Tax=Heliothis virescens TaxID=7102 RepID=A0A2A4JJR3_HELVI